MVGVHGVGKTTTVGKLARHHVDAGRKVLICAADTFRAAAVEQLGRWAARTGVEMIRGAGGADPSAVLFDACAAAKARRADILLVDTAGRLHTKSNLMPELEKMKRADYKEIGEALGVSLHTVRGHLKQLFAKIGTHRQADLIRVLLAGPADIRLE